MNPYILFGGLFLWLLQYAIANAMDSLTVSEMRVHFPTGGVLPLVWHGGIWADLPLTFLLAYVGHKYAAQWDIGKWTVALLVGTLASFAMHQLYKTGTIPEAHVQNGELTGVGWVHFVYMAVALAIILLLYLPYTENPSKTLMWGMTAYLIVHVAVGNHFVLGFINPPDYGGKPLQNIGGWATVIGTGALLVITTILRVG